MTDIFPLYKNHLECRLLLCLICLYEDVFQTLILSPKSHHNVPEELKRIFFVTEYPDMFVYRKSRDIDSGETYNECSTEKDNETKEDASRIMVKYKDDIETSKVFETLSSLQNYFFMCMVIKRYDLFNISVSFSNNVEQDSKIIQGNYNMCDNTISNVIGNAIEGFYYYYGIDISIIDIPEISDTKYIEDTNDFDSIFRHANLLDIDTLLATRKENIQNDIDFVSVENDNCLDHLILNKSVFITEHIDESYNKKYNVPKYINDVVIPILQDNKYNLIIIPYLPSIMNGEDHKNYIIYSKRDNCIMRYDPQGDRRWDLHSSELLNLIFPDAEIYSNETFGFQLYDDAGFCATYAFLFMSLFLIAYQLYPGVSAPKLFYCIEYIVYDTIRTRDNQSMKLALKYIAVKIMYTVKECLSTKIYEFYQPSNKEFKIDSNSFYLYAAKCMYNREHISITMYNTVADQKQDYDTFMSFYRTRKHASIDDTKRSIIQVSESCFSYFISILTPKEYDIYFSYKLLFWTEVLRYLFRLVRKNFPEDIIQLLRAYDTMSMCVNSRYPSYIQYMEERILR